MKKIIFILIIFIILYNIFKKLCRCENFNNSTNILPYALFINIKKRTDRLKNVHNQMKNWPEEKLIRIDAEKRRDGVLGCGLSHIKALEKAKKIIEENNLDYILILEDDFKWKFDFNITTDKLTEVFNSKIDWDVITLITSVFYGAKVEQTENILRKVSNTGSTAGYIIKKNYIDKLLNLWKETMEVRKTRNFNKKWTAVNTNIDQAWKKLQKKDNWYTTNPTLIRIIDSKSDIHGQTDPVLNKYD
jgi:GR25 family glycosyltransferase involved in LPS biosynthesis